VTQRTYTYHILHNFPIKKMNRQVSEGTYFQESVIQSAQNHIFATTMPRGGRVPIEHNEALQLVQNCSAFSHISIGAMCFFVSSAVSLFFSSSHCL
jgi:hypothetical protein